MDRRLGVELSASAAPWEEAAARAGAGGCAAEVVYLTADAPEVKIGEG